MIAALAVTISTAKTNSPISAPRPVLTRVVVRAVSLAVFFSVLVVSRAVVIETSGRARGSVAD
jgi:hypothetical protein